MNSRLTASLFVLFTVLATVAITQAQTLEEKEIRQTYARIALAAEIGAVQNSVFMKGNLDKELANAKIEFRLSDFRVGNVADHLNDHYGEFVSRPVGHDQLQITPGTWTSEEDHRFTYKNVYATIKWIPNPQVMPVEWDSMTLGHVLEAAHATNGSTITRFASYTVQTTFQGKTESTRASFLYGTDKDGKPLVDASDNLNDRFAVDLFYFQPIYPAAFLDNPKTRNHPIVEKWLKSNAQDCPGKKHGNCYDETTGKAGISREDIDGGAVDIPMPISRLRRFEIDQDRIDRHS